MGFDVGLAIASLASLMAAVFALWLLSLKRVDASIADVFWGLGFLLVAGLGFVLGAGEAGRQALVLALVAAWSLRLAGWIAWRHHGRGEDPRYAAMRAEHGDRWPLRSLFQVFVLQGLLIWLVSAPVQAAMTLGGPLGPLDALGAALVAGGLACEAVGDWQLARFKRDPANRGQVMDRGLWRYTRHPNYFGDAVVWWGLYAIAAATGWGALTLPAPALMTFLLVRVSGVALTEAVMSGRPGYAAYVARTSAFVPWPPRPPAGLR